MKFSNLRHYWLVSLSSTKRDVYFFYSSANVNDELVLLLRRFRGVGGTVGPQFVNFVESLRLSERCGDEERILSGRRTCKSGWLAAACCC